MADFKRIGYYDLRAESARGILPRLIGRQAECERLERVINRQIHNNLLIVGPGGIGKTTLVYGWLTKLMRDHAYDALQLLQLDAEHLHAIAAGDDGDERYAEALAALPPAIVFIDDFGKQAHGNTLLVARFQRLYTAMLKNPQVRLAVVLQPHEHAWLVREYPQLTQLFEQVVIKSQSTEEQVQILRQALPRLNHHQILVPTPLLEKITQYTERFPLLGTAPRAALSLLDEALGAAAARKARELTVPILEEVVASKTGVPRTRLTAHVAQDLALLETSLAQSIIGQQNAITRIIATLRRAKLGMRNPNRPLGSFLMLGPSGVGKTETAKVIAEALYGRSESFIRFDMSEFGQEHTVQRLIGAPAGYVGHESGGALTSAIKREPYSLILLDEIEKAHPKVFDIFLQILDDGRITSGQNETIDARNIIIIATSNSGVRQVLSTVAAGLDPNAPEVQAQHLFPALEEHFRVEFLNRFDAVVAFEPLTIEALTAIAHLEMRKLERRLKDHGASFRIDEEVLRDHIRRIADPRFGARPIKRFIEEMCESVLVEKLLKKNSTESRKSPAHTTTL